MPNSEIFPYATVKQVIFQIKFPSLFYIENKIGDFQLKILGLFPNSSLLHYRKFLVADIGAESRLEEIAENSDLKTQKIWKFSNENTEMNITIDSLDINTSDYQSYDTEGKRKFRETIQAVVDSFFDVVQIPFISRLGLRYIDECPFPSPDNEIFKKYFNTAVRVDRFDLLNSEEILFQTLFEKEDGYNLRYKEFYKRGKDKQNLVLDFDCFTKNIAPEDCLSTTDKLRKLIYEEYYKTLNEPAIHYMRTGEFI